VDVDRGDGTAGTPAGKGKGLAPGPAPDIKDRCVFRGIKQVEHTNGTGFVPGPLPVKAIKEGEEK
jgi:hypothetical protein